MICCTILNILHMHDKNILFLSVLLIITLPYYATLPATALADVHQGQKYAGYAAGLHRFMEQAERDALDNRRIPEYDLIMRKLAKVKSTPLDNDYMSIYESSGESRHYTALVIAIANAESSLATTDKDGGASRKYFNPFGYFCVRPNKTHDLDCGFTGDKGNWGYALGRLTRAIIEGYGQHWDGTEQGLHDTFIGSYCASGCDHWVKNVWTSYQYIINY